MGTPGLKSIGLGSECLQGPWDPKGGELYRPTVKPWETVVKAGTMNTCTPPQALWVAEGGGLKNFLLFPAS